MSSSSKTIRSRKGRRGRRRSGRRRAREEEQEEGEGGAGARPSVGTVGISHRPASWPAGGGSSTPAGFALSPGKIGSDAIGLSQSTAPHLEARRGVRAGRSRSGRCRYLEGNNERRLRACALRTDAGRGHDGRKGGRRQRLPLPRPALRTVPPGRRHPMGGGGGGGCQRARLARPEPPPPSAVVLHNNFECTGRWRRDLQIDW